MFNKVEHIGIAVRDLKTAIPEFEELTGVKCYKTEEVDSEGVVTAFFQLAGTKLELLQATREDSAIAKFIEKRGEGIHHIAFDVDSAENEMNRLTDIGKRFINALPKNGADNKRINFLHPKDTHGVLIEVCEEKK